MIDIPEPARWNHSFSSLHTFTDICELRYAYQKTQPFEDTPASRRGSQIHDALDWWAKTGFNPDAYDDMVRIYGEAEEGILTPQELGTWTDNVRELAQQLKPARSEFWIRHRLPGCERPLVGKVDLLANNGPDGVDEPTIVDWKSVTSMSKKPTDYEAGRSVQLMIYCMVVGVRRAALVYFTPNHTAEYVLVQFDADTLKRAARYAAHNCAAIEHRWKNGGWRKALPGGLCSQRWCPLYKKCYGG